eukprot:14008434-Alexandrium_andersonii.AAC.1
MALGMVGLRAWHLRLEAAVLGILRVLPGHPSPGRSSSSQKVKAARALQVQWNEDCARVTALGWGEE